MNTNPATLSLIKAAAMRKAAGGISQMTEWRWRQRGILPEPIRICGHVYYPSDVLARVVNGAAESRPQ